jgi:hypothetical protein
MKYFIDPRGDDFFLICSFQSDYRVGYVVGRDTCYHVENGDSDEIAVVKTLDDVIPAIAAYYETNPPWKYESVTRYTKWTPFGPLHVEQDQSGQWVAYRHYHYPLLRNGQSASFATLEEAQQAADAHASEGYTSSETIYDGFAFRPSADPWQSYPCRIFARARWTASHAPRAG